MKYSFAMSAVALALFSGCSGSHEGGPGGPDAGNVVVDASAFVCRQGPSCTDAICDVDAWLTGLPAMAHVVATTRDRVTTACVTSAPDVVVVWDAATPGHYQVRVSGVAGSEVRPDECSSLSTASGCIAAGVPGSNTLFFYTSVPNQRMLFIGDGAPVGGGVDIAVYPAETCSDGIDNDADGMIDCADAECLGDAICRAG